MGGGGLVQIFFKKIIFFPRLFSEFLSFQVSKFPSFQGREGGREDPWDYMKFQQWLGPFLVDWITTMHANAFLTIFQQCWHMCYSWKIVRNLFASMVVLQSTRTGPKHCWKFMKSGDSNSFVYKLYNDTVIVLESTNQ